MRVSEHWSRVGVVAASVLCVGGAAGAAAALGAGPCGVAATAALAASVRAVTAGGFWARWRGRVSEEAWRSVRDALPEGLVLLRGERVVGTNAAAQRLLDAQEPGHGVSPLLGAIRQVAAICPGPGRQVMEQRLGLPGLGPRAVLVSATRMTDADGLTLVELQDVTDRKDHLAVKSDLVSNVSHELRTPLASIQAYMEMLLDGEAADEATRTEFYRVALEQADRLSRLIDNILNLSRIESGVVRDDHEPVAVADLVAEAVRIVEPQARLKRIALAGRAGRSDPAGRIGPCVRVCRDMVVQSLVNLLGNAVKYTPCGGRVWVEVGLCGSGRMVSVSVHDTGVGIGPGDLPHVFDKFYRASEAANLAPGTGLGLNLVRHAIETVHSGRVVVSSELGRGSVFTLTLPIADNLEGRPVRRAG